jgi:hypothetical protein
MDQGTPIAAVLARPRRRWFRFSLRTLLIFTAAVAAIAAWFTLALRAAQDQRDAVMTLAGANENTWIRYELDQNLVSGLHRPTTWYTDLLGIDFFRSVENVSIGNAGEKVQLSALRRLPKTRSLYLDNVQFSAGDMQIIASLRELEVLNLSETDLSDQDVRELSELKKLKWIDLRGNRLTDASCEWLANHKELRQLNLEKNNLQGRGLSLLLSAPELEELDLSENQIGGLSGVPVHRQLKSLILNGNRITDEDLKELVGLSGLENLDLTHNAITDDGMKYVARLPKLISLSLDGNRITDEGLMQLAACRTLRYLSVDEPGATVATVSRCTVTREGIRQLQEALPKLSVADYPALSPDDDSTQDSTAAVEPRH